MEPKLNALVGAVVLIIAFFLFPSTPKRGSVVPDFPKRLVSQRESLGWDQSSPDMAERTAADTVKPRNGHEDAKLASAAQDRRITEVSVSSSPEVAQLHKLPEEDKIKDTLPELEEKLPEEASGAVEVVTSAGTGDVSSVQMGMNRGRAEVSAIKSAAEGVSDVIPNTGRTRKVHSLLPPKCPNVGPHITMQSLKRWGRTTSDDTPCLFNIDFYQFQLYLAPVPPSMFLAPLKYVSYHSAKKNVMGTGISYYTCVHVVRARLAVVIGTGAGFVPSIVRQAQRDLGPEFAATSRTILIDLGMKTFGGDPSLLDQSSQFHQKFPDIDKWLGMTSHNASLIMKRTPEKYPIDYLHIDADNLDLPRHTAVTAHLTAARANFHVLQDLHLRSEMKGYTVLHYEDHTAYELPMNTTPIAPAQYGPTVRYQNVSEMACFKRLPEFHHRYLASKHFISLYPVTESCEVYLRRAAAELHLAFQLYAYENPDGGSARMALLKTTDVH